MEELLQNLPDKSIPRSSMISALNSQVVREKPARAVHGAVVIRPEQGRVDEATWNRPLRFVLVYLFTYLHLAGPPDKSVINQWIFLEDGWRKEDIPALVSDRSYLRLQVWKNRIPNPNMHIREFHTRMPEITAAIGLKTFAHWFLRMCRGAPEIDQSDTDRTRRCQICGSNILGFPIANHHWHDCLFKRLHHTLKLRFMAINLGAFCPLCGSMSKSHTNHDCDRAGDRSCGRCGQNGHQTYQQICMNGEPVPDQDRLASEAQRAHFERCQRLADEGKLQYPCFNDYPSRVTRQMLFNRREAGDNPLLVGWGKFFDFMEYPTIPIRKYKLQKEFKGLTSQEHDSANVNSNLILHPQDMDKAALLAMVVDYYRFNNATITGRRGNEKIFVLPENIGTRLHLRRIQYPVPPIAPVVPSASQGSALIPQAQQNPQGIEAGNPNQEDVNPSPEDRPNGINPVRQNLSPPSDEYSEDGWGIGNDPENEQEEPEDTTQKEEPVANEGTPNQPREEQMEESPSPKKTRQVITKQETMDAIAKRKIPNHPGSLRLRLSFLYSSLTGDGIPRESADEFDNFDTEVKQDYITLLQGAHSFLITILNIERALPVTITNCSNLLWNHNQDHKMYLPDPMSFKWDSANRWFIRGDQEWWQVYDRIQKDHCTCLQVPRE
ncbi:hypothetical protein CAEBREN_24809 [Caenorhabditis brenneri]|uniref:Uncharacterized protein n=1 Tax=Caenorhabditis brenneri TaxID=135651 RepID=G0P2M6_CAEBE|nr:hypothetical protein CAEBREN_24809 [Caenorhabditis brenneri]